MADAGTPIRIVVCLDVNAESLDDAYRTVKRTLDSACYTEPAESRAFEGWESTDEWFDSDGAPVPEDVMSEVRSRVLASEAELGPDE